VAGTEVIHLLCSRFTECCSFLPCGQSTPQNSKREKVRHLFLSLIYFPLMSLEGVEELKNPAKLKENKFEQLDHEDDYFYLYFYLYLYLY